MIPRLSSNDKRLRSEVWKDLERISDNSTQEELWEIYWDLTQTAESATKIPRSQNRVETRRIIAESIRKVRWLLAKNPEIWTISSLENLWIRIVQWIDWYYTFYTWVNQTPLQVFQSIQQHGWYNMKKIFLIRECPHYKSWALETFDRWMWDMVPINVTNDEMAKGIFMDKMNPSQH